jgi:hypothetical protein
MGVATQVTMKVAVTTPLMVTLSLASELNLHDDDITNMDTPTLVAYDSKVKLFFSIIIFNTYDEWMLHHDICVQCHLQKYLHGSKKAWIMHATDGL